MTENGMKCDCQEDQSDVCNCDEPTNEIERLKSINAELLAACKKAKQSSLCVEARNMIIAAIANAERSQG